MTKTKAKKVLRARLNKQGDVELVGGHPPVVLATIYAGGEGLAIRVVSENFQGAGTAAGPFTTSVEFGHGDGRGPEGRKPSVKIKFVMGAVGTAIERVAAKERKGRKAK